MAPITPSHCRAARGLLDWSLKRLALRFGLSSASLRDFERNRPGLSLADLAVLRATFEAANVLIGHAAWSDDRSGIGVWLMPG
ncbi:XRE family transcriptional regulator [Aureimonas sp. AU22]|uniref:XRE family transcriptional regulator n=1 Tax=Aureimonas sp. AU22 TaxID=1638162 RepID=UPI0012E37B15|nr:XRE family transcriptional regulator [Aureimonas sp. AU22]